MKFLVVTNAPTLKEENKYCAYAPYVREIDIWTKQVIDFAIISPNYYGQTLLTAKFNKQPKLFVINSIDFTTFKTAVSSFLKLPKIIFKIYKAMKWADHIHLRCPGNIGLLGSIVQVFFPNKQKTAKYAGNWDPEAKQPKSYKFQKWLLSNTMLTKNMTVLVYGKWKNQSNNIKPFFTATYKQSEIIPYRERKYSGVLHFVFIGSLVEGKRPLLAIKIIQKLIDDGIEASLDLFGDGILKINLQHYITDNGLSKFIKLKGNQPKDIVQEALKIAHFSILPSKSEGWPKAIAEAMFYGAIPIVTKISCVPYMLDYGSRGILIEPNIEKAVNEIRKSLIDLKELENMAFAAKKWSQQYTLDAFEGEIKKLLSN